MLSAGVKGSLVFWPLWKKANSDFELHFIQQFWVKESKWDIKIQEYVISKMGFVGLLFLVFYMVNTEQEKKDVYTVK